MTDSSLSQETTDDDPRDAEARAMEAKDALMGMIFATLRMRGRSLLAGERSLPLTVIGGFLGSGKTSVLSHLLNDSHGRRLVVLVNDFGRINIDASLVASQTDDMIKLTNGCACCAVSADLTNTLIEIAEREDRPDAIVLEASGIADPGSIVQVALSNPTIRLDGTIVVVDAETIQSLADDRSTGRLFRNQIHAADLVVLSKVDLLDDAARRAALAWLAQNSPDKRVIEAVHGDIPADIILGIETKRNLHMQFPKSADHDHDFESVSFTFKEPLDADRLHDVLDALPPSVLRAKGILNLSVEPENQTIFQRVGQRWNYTVGAPWVVEKPHSDLVFIARKGGLDKNVIRDALESCVVRTGAGEKTEVEVVKSGA